jgi:hypothetical protein
MLWNPSYLVVWAMYLHVSRKFAQSRGSRKTAMRESSSRGRDNRGDVAAITTKYQIDCSKKDAVVLIAVSSLSLEVEPPCQMPDNGPCGLIILRPVLHDALASTRNNQMPSAANLYRMYRNPVQDVSSELERPLKYSSGAEESPRLSQVVCTDAVHIAQSTQIA